jgi:nucleoside-diphosphate kinase
MYPPSIKDLVQQTLIILKPDAVRRGISSEILMRFEKIGLKIVALKMMHVDRVFAEKHYTYEDIALRHSVKIREELLAYIVESPVIVAVIEGINAVEVVRKICGKTEPSSATPGTIRADYCHHTYALCSITNKAVYNVIHASASLPEAVNEVNLWFNKNEIYTYRRSDESEHFQY